MTLISAQSRRRVVTVVEDEAVTRILACEVLNEAGFEVVETQHADAAIRILRDRASEVSAVFTDIQMSGSIDGLGLAHLARQTWPWIAVLLASGRASPRHEQMPEGTRFLPKPYRADQLVGQLRDMIGAG